LFDYLEKRKQLLIHPAYGLLLKDILNILSKYDFLQQIKQLPSAFSQI